MRKWNELFGSDSEDELDSLDRLFFKSSNPGVYPDIDLSELLNLDCTVIPIGRRNIGHCENAQYISGHHCDITCDSKGNVTITPCCKYDVIYMKEELLKKHVPVSLPQGAKVRLCKGHFEYTLHKVGRQRKKRKSCSGTDRASSTQDDLSEPDTNLVVQQEQQHEEWLTMALADVESAAYGRMYTILEATKTLSRRVLVSFHCDICLELIASCRSCAPCGHSFCGPCINGYIKSVRYGRATCPKCRAIIISTLPNKTMDAGIEDSLTSIHTAAKAVAEANPRGRPMANGRDRIPSTLETSAGSSDQMPPPAGASAAVSTGVREEDYDPISAGLVSESQDLSAWTDRYDANEAQAKTLAVGAKAGSATAFASRAAGRDTSEPAGSENLAPRQLRLTSANVFGYNCDSALVEYARSGRATCVFCRDLIPNRSLRFGVERGHDNDEYLSTCFLHAVCAPLFNAARAGHQLTQITLNDLRGMRALSAADRTIVRTLLVGGAL